MTDSPTVDLSAIYWTVSELDEECLSLNRFSLTALLFPETPIQGLERMLRDSSSVSPADGQ